MLLGASLLAGLAGELLRLPKVTAYLIAGIVLGPSVLDAIPHDHTEFLEPLTKLAISLVLFQLGTQFPIDHIRRISRRAIPLSLAELSCTIVLVTIGMMLFGMDFSQAILLGALAMATAPATTMLVLRETGAMGPVTSMTRTLVTLNNIATIVVFEIIWLILHSFGNKPESPSFVDEVGHFMMSIGGAALMGFAGGLMVSYACELLNPKRWLVLLIAVSGCLLGFSQTYDVPYLLTFLVMGVTVVNSSSATERISAQFDSIGGLLTVVFFSAHGAEMNLELLWNVGLLGVAYITLRTIGKMLGLAVAAKQIHAPIEMRTWLGPAMLAQAGVAISLSTTANDRDPSLVPDLQTIILGTVIVFEIIGPLLTRAAVLHSGEMPLANSIHHTFGTPLGALKNILTRLAGSTGLIDDGGATPRMSVEQVMRRSIDGIAEDANFNEVIEYVEHSHDNTFPVLDKQLRVVGLIRFDLLNEAFFDPGRAALLCANDLATPPEVLLHPSQPISEVVELFKRTTDDCVPVVAETEPNVLVGTVRRSDLTNLLIRARNKKPKKNKVKKTN
jgi:Kef-type K+ transport system membrane component KefB